MNQNSFPPVANSPDLQQQYSEFLEDNPGAFIVEKHPVINAEGEIEFFDVLLG